MVLAISLTGVTAIALILALFLGAGAARLLWQFAVSLWEERNYILCILFALAICPIAIDPALRDVIGPFLLVMILVGGAYKFLDQLAPIVATFWRRQSWLTRLTLIGAWLDLSAVLKQYL